jgi:two-component sensor histidine kinase
LDERRNPSNASDPGRLAEELSRTRAELAAARRDAMEARARAEAARGPAAALSDLAVAAPGALWVAEAESGRGIYVSPGVGGLLGVPPQAVLPEAGRWLGLVHPDDRAAVAGRFATLCRGEMAEVTYRVLPPGEGMAGATRRSAARWVSDLGFPITDARGRVRRVAGFARAAGGDGSEEGLRRLLLAELNHRVRNALAAVQAVAATTARGAADAGSLWEAFAGRLRAMAQAHDVVAGRGWTEGAELRALLEAELAPYLRMAGAAGPHADLDGPQVRLSPAAALAFALALHELATNAARHGALSVASGRLRVRWDLLPASSRSPSAAPQLRLDWVEEGGPVPAAPPLRRGFGTRLLSSALPAQLGGRVSLDFQPSGLHAVVEAALARPGEPLYAPPPDGRRDRG